jgi:hypothetical protein
MTPLVLLVTLLGTPPEAGGFYFEQTTQRYEDGQAQGPSILSKVWISGRKMRLEAGGERSPVLLLRLDRSQAVRLDPVGKVATSIPLDDLRSRTQLDLAAAGEMMGGAEEGSARTRALEGTRVIAGQTCEGYRIKSPGGTTDVWVARGAGIGVDAFAEFLEWSGADQAVGGLLSELRRLPGFPMETRSRVVVLGRAHDAVSTVGVLRVERVDPQMFETPPDYRLVLEPKEP